MKYCLTLFCLFCILAVPAAGDSSVSFEYDPDALEAAPEPLRFDLLTRGFDPEGYPENENGLLVVKSTSAGVVIPLKNDPYGSLLYAQFVNRQRDAVLLAREGDISDTLPDGTAFAIPYGFGAVRMNSSYISLVEGQLIPHTSDNIKTHILFPLSDFSLGGSFGVTGLSFMLRYTYLENYAVHFKAGINTFGSYFGTGPFGYYGVPVHFGAGYRFPGGLEQFFGRNNLTVGLDFFAGFGDRDEKPDTPSFYWIPGVFLDFEKFFFSGTDSAESFRTDARPFNYRVHSAFLRIGAYVNTIDPLKSGIFLFDVSVGFLFGVKGPDIPEHQFKETLSVYVSPEYREDIARQKERKEQRIKDSKL